MRKSYYFLREAGRSFKSGRIPRCSSFQAKALMCRPPHSELAMSAAHSAGRRAGRVLSHRRAPFIFPWLVYSLQKGRDTGITRFRRPTDWRRLVALGVVLIDFAILSIANRLLDHHFDGYLPGLGSVLGGLLFGIIIFRLARPALYLDWIAIGVLQAATGCIVSIDPELGATGTFPAVCSLLLVLSGLRLWTGETVRPRRGAASLLAGGYATLFLVLWLLISHRFRVGTGPDMVLAADLLIAGLSMLFFGLSLRPGKGCN